jgi:hypothetical protein
MKFESLTNSTRYEFEKSAEAKDELTTRSVQTPAPGPPIFSPVFRNLLSNGQFGLILPLLIFEKLAAPKSEFSMYNPVTLASDKSARGHETIPM